MPRCATRCWCWSRSACSSASASWRSAGAGGRLPGRHAGTGQHLHRVAGRRRRGHRAAADGADRGRDGRPRRTSRSCARCRCSACPTSASTSRTTSTSTSRAGSSARSCRRSKERLPAGLRRARARPEQLRAWARCSGTRSSDADKKLVAMDLRTLHDWTVRLILRTAPGVDDVTSWGGHEKQYQVQIDPQRLVKYGLSFKDGDGAAGGQQQAGRRAVPQHRRRAVPRARARAGEQRDRHRRHRRCRAQAARRSTCATSPR